MKNINIILAAILLICVLQGKAQQDVQFTHYMYNTLSVNPAYAGSRGMLSASALHRQQWMGIEGAPVTQTISLHTPLISKNIGVGLSIVSDKVGPTRQNTFFADYAFSIKLNEKSKLALGVKGGFNAISADVVSLRTNEANDKAFMYNPTKKVAPNFGFGVYYHADNFYLGASTPKLLQTKIENTQTDQISRMIRHYYFIGGAVFAITPEFKIKPAFMTKVTQNAPLSIDLSCEAFYKENVSLGIMHRVGDSFGFLIGYQFTPQLHTGISYDYTITKLTNYNSGTIELFLRYDFVFKKEKMITPRYF